MHDGIGLWIQRLFSGKCPSKVSSNTTYTFYFLGCSTRGDYIFTDKNTLLIRKHGQPRKSWTSFFCCGGDVTLPTVSSLKSTELQHYDKTCNASLQRFELLLFV